MKRCCGLLTAAVLVGLLVMAACAMANTVGLSSSVLMSNSASYTLIISTASPDAIVIAPMTNEESVGGQPIVESTSATTTAKNASASAVDMSQRFSTGDAGGIPFLMGANTVNENSAMAEIPRAGDNARTL